MESHLFLVDHSEGMEWARNEQKPARSAMMSNCLPALMRACIPCIHTSMSLIGSHATVRSVMHDTCTRTHTRKNACAHS